MKTRKEYMDGVVSHQDYYAEIAHACGASIIAYPELLAKVKAALADGDEHLNKIPLSRWDNLAAGFRVYHRREMDGALRERGDGYSLAGGVCIFKAIAKEQARS